MDKVILGDGCFLEDGIGTWRPNDNQIVIGGSGTGKSKSIMLPTILNMNDSSMIATYDKAGEARKILKYMRKKGYVAKCCDLVDPSRSNAVFDPLRYVTSYLDVDDLAKSIILADPDSKNVKDIYWNDGATTLLGALMLVTMIAIDNATMTDVLELFDVLEIKEDGKGITTSLDELFENVEMTNGKCPAVTAYADFQQLPYTTAGCIRDSLAKALRRIFPEPVRRMMKGENLIDFEELATQKTALMIITSPVNTSLYLFANLVFSTAIKQLLEYAEHCKEQRLPRPVRLLFDDFACAAKINDYSKHIAIFRSAGISAMMLLQSESQLRQMYSEAESENILNNCSVYAYFPGGMDLFTCKNIAQRLDVPLTDVLYAPMEQVIIMQTGKKPVRTKRYDILNSSEYKQFLEMTDRHDKRKREVGIGSLHPGYLIKKEKDIKGEKTNEQTRKICQ